MSVEFLDVEYLIRKDNSDNNAFILSVQSRQNNCSSHIRLLNDIVKEKGIGSIFEHLKSLEEAMIYQKTNDLIKIG